jgi:kinesin family protein 15
MTPHLPPTIPFPLQRAGREVKFICRCSMLEIYRENITDLLQPGAARLHLREDIKRGVYVEALAQEQVSCGE